MEDTYLNERGSGIDENPDVEDPSEAS